MKELKGTVALIPTPMTDEGGVDEAGLRKLIDFDMQKGCDGVGVLAAIGEGYLFSVEDQEKIVRIAKDAMAGRGPLIVGCPAMSTVGAVEACKRAEGWGADAILAFNPKYKGFDAYGYDHLVPHYTAMAEAVQIPLAPYSQLDDPIPFDVIKYLVDQGLIRHMKYGPHDCATLKRIIDAVGDKLFIFAGADTFILRHLMLGANGISIATAAIFPEECSRVVQAVGEGRIDDAREVYRKSLIYWNDLGFYNCWQAVHKIALQHLGIIESARCMPPLTNAEDYQKEEIESLLKFLNKID